MNTTFYTIKDENAPYDILFHEPTSKFARIRDEKITLLSQKQLCEMFPDLDEPEQEDKYIIAGKGRIGLTFMSARTCNLNCKYCFAGEGEYGSVENKPKFYTAEAYEKAVKTAVKMYPDGVKSISFFGGEPLLNWKEIEKFVPRCVDYFAEIGLPVPQMAISTNMIIMNRDIANFMKKYHINAVLSLDGPKNLNDYARVSADPSFSVYDTVIEKSRILDELGVKYSVQATFNKQLLKTYKKGDGVRYIEELSKIKWENLVIVPVETDISDLSITEDDYPALEAFAREITNYYIDVLCEGNKGRVASGIVAPILQIAKNKHIRTCSSGHSVFCDTDGSIYPCQMFCNEDEYKLGDIENGWSMEKSEEISNITRNDSEECKNCLARNICFMWCKGLQLQSNGDIYQTCKPRSIFQRANTEECIKLLARIKSGEVDEKKFWENFKAVGDKLREDGFIYG